VVGRTAGEGEGEEGGCERAVGAAVTAGAATVGEPNVVVVRTATVTAETATTVAAAAAISRHLLMSTAPREVGRAMGALPEERR
jgi:hypothetical protein